MRKHLAALVAASLLTLIGCAGRGPVEPHGGPCEPSIWTVVNDVDDGVVWEDDCGDTVPALEAQAFAIDLWGESLEPEDYYGMIEPSSGGSRIFHINRIDDTTHQWENYDPETNESLAIPADDWELGTTFVLMP